MFIPKIIHFTIPEHPSERVLANIQIARDLHPDWKVVVWQDPVERSNFVLAKYWDKANSGAQLADLIRLEVVYQQGGFYVDSDFKILRNLDPLRMYPFLIASENGRVLTNAFFAAEQHSPVVKHLIDRLDKNEPDWKLTPVYTTGPIFFAQELKWRNDVMVVPRETFYPYHWAERATTPRLWTYAMHQWTGSWKYTWSTRSKVREFLSNAKLKVKLRLQRTRRRLLAASRQFLLRLRHTLRLHTPEPFSANGVICAQTVHGPKIYLLGEDATVTPGVALHGTYEFQEELFVQRVVRPGDCVIDVGANVGMHSLLFAQSVGPFGRIFSYEPNPLPAGLLKKSLVMNWFHDRVVVREKALSSQAGTSRLRFNKGGLGGATLSDRTSAGTFESNVALLGDEQAIDVETSSLDAEFPINLPIRLLKIDVEGFEHHVLQGASRLLHERCIDILMLECSKEVYGSGWHEYLAEIKKVMELGYDLYTLNRASKLIKLSFTRLLYAERSKNVFLVSQDARRTIRELA